MSAVRIGIVGVAGRMGQAITREIAASKGAAVLAGGIEQPGEGIVTPHGKRPAIGRKRHRREAVPSLVHEARPARGHVPNGHGPCLLRLAGAGDLRGTPAGGAGD